MILAQPAMSRPRPIRGYLLAGCLVGAACGLAFAAAALGGPLAIGWQGRYTFPVYAVAGALIGVGGGAIMEVVNG
jgi:hypothetical protein